MSQKVLKISHAHSPSELETLLTDPGCEIQFVHVGHGEANLNVGTNLVKLARSSASTRELLTTLVNNGFYTYLVKDNATRLVHHKSLPKVWIKLTSGECEITPEGIVYSLHVPPGVPAKRLLVVFSSIHGDMNTPGLMRYFEQNFASISKYVPHDTAILRIADLGGICGAFYLNTTFLPRNAENIQIAIDRIRNKLELGKESVVLYGTSKGGTGALYHAIKGHYRCVAVDPIVADEHYVTKYGDLHFTNTGAFPKSKEHVFDELMKELDTIPSPLAVARWSVILSDRSPQHKYLSRTLVDRTDRIFSFFESRHPAIKDHPDVGPNTVNTATALINFHLYAVPVTTGTFIID